MVALVAHSIGAGLSSATTTAANTTGANLIVVHISIQHTVSPVVSDSNSNTYTQVYFQPGGVNNAAYMYYCLNPVVGAAHTVTVTGSSGGICAIIEAFSGIKTSGALDKEIGQFTSSVSSQQPGSITPSVDGCLIITSISMNAGTGASPMSVNGSFSITDQLATVGGTNYGGAMAWEIQATAAAINPTWTNNASGDLSAIIASFEPALGVYNPKPPHRPPKPKGKPQRYSVADTSQLADLYRREVIAPRTRHKLLSFSTNATVNLSAAAATGAVGSLTFSTATTVNLSGVAATAGIGSLAPTINPSFGAVAATGVAEPFVISAGLQLIAASASGVAEPFSIQASSNLSLNPAGARGFAAPFSPSFSSMINLQAVAAFGVAATLTAKTANPTPVVDSYSIMRNKPVPSVGEMDNTIVANQGPFL